MSSKHVFQTLDGLRCLAAIAVVTLHMPEVLGGVPFPRAYLAVDLFFAMSGVVIAHAYDGRLSGGMGVRAFMVARLLRLYPLYILGTLISVAGILAGFAAGISFEAWTPTGLAQTILPALLFLPSYTPGIATLYPLNWPAWSLMFELIANLAFALAFPRLTRRVLAVLCGLVGLWIVATALAGGTVWVDMTWENLASGFARVFFSFPLGILLYRLWRAGRLPRVAISPWLIMGLTAVILALPMPDAYVPVWEAFSTIVLLPLICVLAIQNEPSAGKRVCLTLGIISYPLYMLHGPIYYATHRILDRLTGGDLTGLTPWIGIVLMAAMIFLSLAADRFYDHPVRRWLQGRLAARRERARVD